MSARGRTALLAAAAAYYLATVFLHDPVSQVYTSIFNIFGRRIMEGSLHALSLILAAAVLALALAAIRRRNGAFLGPALLWALGFGLAAAADAWLIVTNVERVHYPQYAVLALLLLAVRPNYLAVLVVCALAGALDELAQYVMFPQYTDYLDFNDFVLNLIGAGLGLALYASVAWRGRRPSGPGAADLRAVLAGLGLALVLFAAGWAGFIAWQAPVREGYHLIQEVDGRRAFVLSFRTDPDFRVRSEHGRIYHILSPIQGASALAAILGAYAFVLTGLSRMRQDRPTSKT